MVAGMAAGAWIAAALAWGSLPRGRGRAPAAAQAGDGRGRQSGA